MTWDARDILRQQGMQPGHDQPRVPVLGSDSGGIAQDSPEFTPILEQSRQIVFATPEPRELIFPATHRREWLAQGMHDDRSWAQWRRIAMRGVVEE